MGTLRRTAALAAMSIGCAAAAAPAHAQQQDEITPVVATAVSPPQPVVGADGRRHLAYELLLQNRSAAAATVRELQVLVDGRLRRTLRQNELKSLTVPFGAKEPGTKLAGGQGGYVVVDVALPRSARPQRVLHRLSVALKPTDATAAVRYRTGATRVGQRNAVEVSAPLRGKGWVVANGCCDALTAHRGAVLPVNGAFHAPERFAIDFVQLGDRGTLFEGPRNRLESYPFYDDQVLSATTGRVVTVVEGLPDTPAGAFPKNPTAATAGGNHVVVDMGRGRFAFYAHLRPSSVPVEVGDRVRVGQELGRLGNSGNTDAPHLHFHVMDSPSPLGSEGLPFVFDRFSSDGSLQNFDAVATGARAQMSGRLKGSLRAALPLNLQVIGFDSR